MLTETVARTDARTVLLGLLHAVCFFRLLGTLKPSSADVLGVEMVRHVALLL